MPGWRAPSMPAFAEQRQWHSANFRQSLPPPGRPGWRTASGLPTERRGQRLSPAHGEILKRKEGILRICPKTSE